MVRLHQVSQGLRVKIRLDLANTWLRLLLAVPVIEAVTPRPLLKLSFSHFIPQGSQLGRGSFAHLMGGHVNT